MSTVTVAISAADAQAVAAVTNHHAQLAGALAVQVEALLDAAARGDRQSCRAASVALVRWCQAELVPHALAEEKALYPAAHADPRARMLVDAMLVEHQGLLSLVEAIEQAAGPVQAAANAQALRSLFDSHLAKENEQILPLLAESSEVSLADLLGDMAELLGGNDQAHQADGADVAEGGCGGECGCGHQDQAEAIPELDARVLPHARYAMPRSSVPLTR